MNLLPKEMYKYMRKISSFHENKLPSRDSVSFISAFLDLTHFYLNVAEWYCVYQSYAKPTAHLCGQITHSFIVTRNLLWRQELQIKKCLHNLEIVAYSFLWHSLLVDVLTTDHKCLLLGTVKYLYHHRSRN